MRSFVLVGHTQPLDSAFSLDDLPGGAGRLDVLCRNLTAALLLSHDIRRDTTVWLVIQDEFTIEVRGGEVRHLRPDERTTGALLRSALETAADRAVSPHPVESSAGVYVRRQGLERTVDELATDHTLVRLDPGGRSLEAASIGEPVAFVLSDHEPLTEAEITMLDDHGAVSCSLGPRTIHGDQAIAVAHNVLDRAGDESGGSGTTEV